MDVNGSRILSFGGTDQRKLVIYDITYNIFSKMSKALFFLCVLPFIVTGRNLPVDPDDADFDLGIFFCGVQDPYDTHNSRLVRVRSQLNMEINNARIINIRNSVFEHCGETRALSIAHNKLANLTGKRLEGLPNVRALNFFDNVIEHVENGTFDKSPHLYELELSYNRLEGLDAGVQNGLRELRLLHLNQNPIILRKDGFLGLSKLKLLELTGANISDIPDGSFNGLGHLRRLDLSRNNLTSILESSFGELIQLEELDLSMNQISEISKDTFNGLANLKALWLNDNQIGSLRTYNIFESIPNLKSLYFHQNPLQFLDIGIFRNMQSVVIEPGFVIDILKVIRKNFANVTSTMYHCSKQLHIHHASIHSESDSENFETTTFTPVEDTENEENNYFAPYYCYVLTKGDSASVTMI